ncbi:uncharacterized protein LOC143300122 [Babylonia areolata]|uniref:uncharacterized protein LOC143300122 n=1 Tax=Babylonia areolata TaxID=304850 RepID=UPI003FD496F2
MPMATPSRATAAATVAATLLNVVAGLMMALFVTVLLSPAGVASSCSVELYAMDLRSCFRIRKMGDEVIIYSKGSLVETSLQLEGMFVDPQRVCREKETFSDLFDCLAGTTTKCLTTEEEKDYLPDPTLAKEGLNYLCQHADDIDGECYNQTYSDVFGCVNQLSADNIMWNDTASTRACVTVDITHDCIHEHVDCDVKTRDLLLKFQDEYRKPKGCPAPARSNRKKYITSTGSSSVFPGGFVVSKLFCVILSCVLVFFLHAD